MLKYLSQYEGEDFDKTIEWVKSQREFSTSHILESSPTAKVDLNDVSFQQGTFTIHYYTNSYDDSSANPINLDVIFLNDGDILQRYDYFGNTVQRFKQGGVWGQWAFVKNFISVNEGDSVSVSADTLVLRSLTTPVSEYFKESE